jgi:glucose-6-phosphate 1-dehydrogenase
MTEANPAHDPPRQAGPCAVVIFGASGDLTRRKLLPALFNLALQNLLPDGFVVVAFARRDLGTQAFREQMRVAVEGFVGDDFDAAVWSWLESRIHYVRGGFDDPDAYDVLSRRLEELQEAHDTGGHALFYLATAPAYFGPVVCRLQAVGLTTERGDTWRRVVIEKPFGRDLASATALNVELLKVLSERQIYRIDHYLGKETVQNLLVFRFANGIFEPVWNRRYVDHVQITVAETLGVEGRGGYYDSSGALRDMLPSHIFQLVSLLAMEPPISFDADSVRDEQSKVLRAIQIMSPEDVLQQTVRGQYRAGEAGGKQLPAYRSEDRVSPESATETYVAMKLGIDNWRWKDIPFYLRVGKAMPRRLSEITVVFKRPPFTLFQDTPVDDLVPNQLVINVQPDEGIALHFGAKVPGAAMRVGNVQMEFCYSKYFEETSSTGYERLLYDAVLGDQTLFRRADMVESGWRVVEPMLDVWEALAPREFPNYAAGSWGPDVADQLLARDGRSWREVDA